MHPTLPVVAAVRPVQVGILAVAIVLPFRLRWSVLRTLGVCAVARHLTEAPPPT